MNPDSFNSYDFPDPVHKFEKWYIGTSKSEAFKNIAKYRTRFIDKKTLDKINKMIWRKCFFDLNIFDITDWFLNLRTKANRRIRYWLDVFLIIIILKKICSNY